MWNRIEYQDGEVVNNIKIIKELKPDVYFYGKRKAVFRKFIFECYCGKEFITTMNCIRTGNTKSCGCYQKSGASERRKTHGDSNRTYLYGLWANIKSRCFNENFGDYIYYGGRGIEMHIPWVDDYVIFRDWILENLGERPKDYTIDRINNNGDYEPGNLRWATRGEQAINKRVHKNNTSGYTGVYLRDGKGKARSIVHYKGENINLGDFKSAHRAVFARNRYIVENGLPHAIQQINMDL